jgi:HK97 family phage major capsid protein
MTANARRQPAWETRDAGGDDPVTEIRSSLQTFTTDATARLQAIDATVTALRTRVDGIETRGNRPAADRGDAGQADERRTAFVSYARHGVERMRAEETRALLASNDTAGGYLAPEAFVAELDRNLVNFSPVRSVARVSTIAAGAAVLPRRTGRLTATWVGEQQPRPETQPAFGTDRFDVKELACYVDVASAMLEDAAFDVGAELAFDFAEEFGRAEGAAFVNGDGVMQPGGFLSDSRIAYTPSGDATGLGTSVDALIDCFHAVHPSYRQTGVWMMNGKTLAALRKFRDALGMYFVQIAGIENSPQTTFLGRPVIEAPDMPNIAANAEPIVFGDFSVGYRVFDRLSLSVLRDPYSQAALGMTRFHARRRVAGGVRRPEAIRKIRIATS